MSVQVLCPTGSLLSWGCSTLVQPHSQKHVLLAGFSVNRCAVLFSPKYTWHLRVLLELVCVEPVFRKLYSTDILKMRGHLKISVGIESPAGLSGKAMFKKWVCSRLSEICLKYRGTGCDFTALYRTGSGTYCSWDEQKLVLLMKGWRIAGSDLLSGSLSLSSTVVTLPLTQVAFPTAAVVLPPFFHVEVLCCYSYSLMLLFLNFLALVLCPYCDKTLYLLKLIQATSVDTKWNTV